MTHWRNTLKKVRALGESELHSIASECTTMFEVWHKLDQKVGMKLPDDMPVVWLLASEIRPHLKKVVRV